jgi:hypothetical protein
MLEHAPVKADRICVVLSIERLEMAEAAEIGVVLERYRPAFGKIVSGPRGRRKIERAEALKRSVEDRIDDQVHGPDTTADDGADLARVAGRFPVPGVKAELEIDAVKKLRSCACGTTNSERSLATSIRKRPSPVQEYTGT